jgi:predicted Zn-dependent protease
MKRALVFLGLVLGAGGVLDAQFNIPSLPFSNPFHPSTPSTTTPNSQTLKGLGEMAQGATGISLKDEMKIGGAVAVEIVSRNGGIDRDPAMTQRVIMIGKSLSYYCSRPELNFRFAVLNSDHINAFSAPGGYVFITRGLYNVLPDDQQLAAVLAHEISHVTKRHALKVISRGEFMKGLFDAGGSVSNTGVFDQGVESITDSLFTKGFDPGAEFEADSAGRALATKVGYNHDALLVFLKDLYKTEGDSKDAFPTHPPLSHRIARLEQ